MEDYDKWSMEDMDQITKDLKGLVRTIRKNKLKDPKEIADWIDISIKNLEMLIF